MAEYDITNPIVDVIQSIKLSRYPPDDEYCCEASKSCSPTSALVNRKRSAEFKCNGVSDHQLWTVEPSVLLDCPKFGTTPAMAVAAQSPIGQHYGEGPNPNVVCSYNRDWLVGKTQDVQDWTEFNRRLTGDPAWWDHDLMREHCALKQTTPALCPASSAKYTEGGATKCSNMLSDHMCKEWAESSTGRSAADSAMEAWCAANTDPNAPLDPTKTDPACACINMRSDPVWQLFKDFSGVPGCWYSPCVDSTMKERLVTYINRHPADCADVCQQVIAFIDSHDIDNNVISQEMSCGSNGPDCVQIGSRCIKKSTLVIAAAATGAVGGVVLLGVLGYLIFKKTK
jgi:hypothetical protein